MQLTLNTPNGQRNIAISKFPACTGYFIEQNYKKFLTSDDQEFKKQFLYEVLSYAKVVNKSNEREISLSTSALIDNQLGDWKTLSTLFKEILKYNEIEIQLVENQRNYWQQVGEQLAVSFVANTTKLLEPFMSSHTEKKSGQESPSSN